MEKGDNNFDVDVNYLYWKNKLFTRTNIYNKYFGTKTCTINFFQTLFV